MDNYQRPTANDADENGDEVPAQPAGLTIIFRDANQQNEVSFKLKPTTKMKKAMDAYSARAQRDPATLRFLFEGVRVLDEHTPESLDMEDGVQVDVYTEQIGGSGVAVKNNI